MNNLRTCVEIRLPRGEVRRWQAHVAATLAADPTLSLRIALVDPGPPPPAGLDTLFAFERVFVGRHAETATDRVDPPALASASDPADLVIDLAGEGPIGPVPVLRPSCLGLRPLEGALAAVLDDRVPDLALDLVRDGGSRRLGLWPAAIEDRGNALRATSMVLGRLAHMILVAVAALRRDGLDAATLSCALDCDPAPARDVGIGGVGRLAWTALAGRIARKLTKLAGRRPDWRTVWRFRAPGTDPLDPSSDPTPFRLLADDGARFFADPFPWDGGDRTFLFVEEFPYATGKGILSLAEIDATGRVTPPRPILEQDCHLSYPQIFAHGGEMWMVPETSGRRTVELWRAARFPDDWRLHAVLIADVDLADATLVETAGRWWMFGTARCPWGSSWDALHLYSAPALEGPWTAVSPDPLVTDVRAARPAGRLVHDGRNWLRPVQDSSRGYGCGLALTRVDRLDESGFAERLDTRFTTPAPLSGLHTWNRAQGAAGLFETLDVVVEASAYGAARVLDLAPRRAGGAASRPAGLFENMIYDSLKPFRSSGSR